jgi:hypothetical protein
VICAPGAGYAQLDVTSDTTQTAVEKQQADALDHLVGRFVRGETPLLRGTLQAHDNASALGPPTSKDADIPLGDAFATFEDGGSGTTQLFVHHLATKQFVQLAQHGGASTDIYMILPEGTTGGRFGTCDACAPAFSPAPDSVDIADAQVSYQGAYSVTPMTISVTTSLAAVPPCSLTFADLAPMAPDSFVLEGAEMVSHVSSIYVVDPNAQCSDATPYTIDLYVNANAPWIFGVRNYKAGVTQQVCHQDPPGNAP